MRLSVSCKEDMVNGKVCSGQSCRGLKAFEKKGRISNVTSSLKKDYDVIFTVIFVLSYLAKGTSACRGGFCLS